MSDTAAASDAIRAAIRLVEGLPAGPLSRDALTMLRSAAARIAQLDTHTEILMQSGLQGSASPPTDDPVLPAPELTNFTGDVPVVSSKSGLTRPDPGSPRTENPPTDLTPPATDLPPSDT